MAGNREYKSDVFSMLMEDRNNALQLYNAVNGSDYTDPETVEICNLDKGISLSVRNDAAFVLDMNLSVYEHQSTVCPNMPVRSLVYFSIMLKEIIRDRNIYGRTLVKIPTPRFAVFYNGDEEQPEQYDMKLSDAFVHQVDDPDIELKCRVYNINYGKNKDILDKCTWLKEYMTFVDYVREFHRENGYDELENAIERAIDRCIEEDVLRRFLIDHRSEVVKVMKLDYTFDRQITLERAESRTEGHAEGRAEGRAEGHAEGHAEGLTEGEEKKLIELVCKKIRKGKNAEEIAEILEEETAVISRIYDVAVKFSPEYDCDKIYEELHKYSEK